MHIKEAFEQVNLLGKQAPELVNFQDEPPQMESGSVGKKGYLHLNFQKSGNRSILQHMERRVPSLVQKALYWDEELPQMPCVFMISTSGCVLQGDRLILDIHVGRDACGHVTTQSATKIHSMENNYAAQKQTITLEENSYLELMPDPVIPHCGSRFINDTDITIHPTATLIYSEVLMSGRKHHSPDRGFRFKVYSSHLKATSTDKDILFTERYVLDPNKNSLNTAGVMGPFDVFGNVILLTPKSYHQKIMEQMPSFYNEQEGIAYGASLLPNDAGIIFKALGKEAQQVKKVIREFWRISREVTMNATLAEPFLWR